MPATTVVFYCEDGGAPVLIWLDDLSRRDRRAYNKCVEAISRLSAFGHELRRPTADLLEDGIYELRVRVGRVNYRLLYCFAGRNRAVLCHGVTKERAIDSSDLVVAKRRRDEFVRDPQRHTFVEE
ncbi:MAG TPA: type II toxin-antitoxin system RelE/ParE family toxin [Tepidisphaeraceae bacterium]|nr:type II toxin-antitoxin system RelE/ParE family toxin [Tepidisphaeraceae bacterium]